MTTKKRLDTILADLFPHLSRTSLQNLIKQGAACVDGKVVVKPGAPVAK